MKSHMTATRMFARLFVSDRSGSICFFEQTYLSCTYIIMTSPPSLDRSPSYVPYLRRRNTPAQLHALHQLFDATPHPTRAQRQALANEIGMYVPPPPPSRLPDGFPRELKSVTNWFQNRRQTSRKKSLSLNENNPSRSPVSPGPARHQHRRSKTPLDRSKISLDRIVSLSERPGLTWQLNSPRLPLTPRKCNIQQKNPSSPSELWTHMLSSPAVPRSSPDPEEARFAALSSRAKTLCPLEWACLKARHKKWVDEDADGLSKHAVVTHCRELGEDGAEPEVINLESEISVPPHSDTSNLNRKNALFSRPNVTPQFEDVEAAITLLGFKTRS